MVNFKSIEFELWDHPDAYMRLERHINETWQPVVSSSTSSMKKKSRYINNSNSDIKSCDLNVYEPLPHKFPLQTIESSNISVMDREELPMPITPNTSFAEDLLRLPSSFNMTCTSTVVSRGKQVFLSPLQWSGKNFASLKCKQLWTSKYTCTSCDDLTHQWHRAERARIITHKYKVRFTHIVNTKASVK